MSESEFEPVPGLPETLPQGERMLWQGKPQWRTFALTAFRLKAIAVCVFGLIAVRFLFAAVSGESLVPALVHALWLCALAVAALAILAGIAYLTARTTVYTITDRRVVMRYGTALPLMLNIPFSLVEAASLHRLNAGAGDLAPGDLASGDLASGDLALRLKAGEHLAYLTLWPHARPWHLRRPEPMLRAVADVDRVAALLANALARSAGQDMEPIPAPETAPNPAAREPRPLSGGRAALAS